MTQMHPDLVYINSVGYALATGRDGAPMFSSVREPATATDQAPKTWVVPLGRNGMGSSLEAVDDQMDYSLDCDTEQYGELGPGPLQTKLGLALDYPVTVITAATDGGPKSGATTSTDNGSGGTIDWTNAANVVSSNNSYATVGLTAANGTSYYLRLTNFSFVIPTGATILGIQVDVEASRSGNNLTAVANLQMLRAGSVVGSSKTFGSLTGTDTYYNSGSASDLWGTTWTVAQVTASTFGVALWMTSTPGAGTDTISIDHIRITVFYNLLNRYLFIGAGAQMNQTRLHTTSGGAALSSVATTTFSHGDGGQTAVITDICSPKDSVVYSGSSAPPAFSPVLQPGDGFLLVGFGGTAQIQQVDAINDAGVSTRTLASSKAYGGVFAVAVGQSNTSPLIWKSTGTSSGNRGAFTLLHSSAISTTTKDFTDSASWAGGYQMGGFGDGINSLVEHERGLHGGKADGVYGFDRSTYATFARFGARHYRDIYNCRALLAWGEMLVIPTIQDLAAIPAPGPDPTIGLSTLVSNLSPVTGLPMATAAYGKYLFCAYYDGTDTYICRAKPRIAERVPHRFLWYPVTKEASHRVQVMKVETDGNGTVYLFRGCNSATANKYDVSYMILDPPSARRYQTGGDFRSTRFGDPQKLMVVHRIIAYGVSCDSSNYWTVSLAWDEGSFNTVGATGRINANGRNVLTPTAGTNDSGYIGQLKAVSTLAASTNRPRIRGSSGDAQTGEAGFLIEGTQQPDQVDRIRMTLVVGPNKQTGQGGSLRARDGWSDYNTLKVLRGAQSFRYYPYHGDKSAHTLIVQKVTFRMAPQDGASPPGRYVDVEGFVPINGA